MQITVPVGGANVIPEGEGPARDGAPAVPQRKSLHTVRMPSTVAQPDYEPKWTDNMRLKWLPVPAEAPEEQVAEAEEPLESTIPRGNGLPDAGTAQPHDALRQEIAELKQTVLLMAQGQQPQQPQGPQPPNPEDFDFYEPAQVKEFHKLNNAYIQATVQQSVQAALAPHGVALQDAQLISEHNRLVASYGEDPNFKAKMGVAVDLFVKFRDRISLTEAFEAAYVPSQPAAQPQGFAKPAQRTLTAQEAAHKAAQAHSLPPRNGVSGTAEPSLPDSLRRIDALGRIMLSNQQTGRARPI
jgi:hypothetical protein